MKRRTFNPKVTLVFADGTSMTESEFLANGKTINAADNIEVEKEMRMIFNPEYAKEYRMMRKIESINKRQKELMAEIKKLEDKTLDEIERNATCKRI